MCKKPNSKRPNEKTAPASTVIPAAKPARSILTSSGTAVLPTKLSNSFTKRLFAAQAQAREDGHVVRQYREMAGASNSNQKEGLIECVTFFDYFGATDKSKAVKTAGWNLNQDLLGQVSGLGTSAGIVCKPTRVDFYCLPRTTINSSVAQRTFVALFGLGVTSGAAGQVITATQNTVIQPDYNIEWIHLGGWSSDHVFRDSNLQPQVDGEVQQIGKLSFVDPESGTPAGDNEEFQCAIVVTAAQAMPVLNDVNVAYSDNSDWTGVAKDAVGRYAMMDLKGLRNMQ